jgi:hypothetical protein
MFLAARPTRRGKCSQRVRVYRTYGWGDRRNPGEKKGGAEKDRSAPHRWIEGSCDKGWRTLWTSQFLRSISIHGIPEEHDPGLPLSLRGSSNNRGQGVDSRKAEKPIHWNVRLWPANDPVNVKGKGRGTDERVCRKT